MAENTSYDYENIVKQIVEKGLFMEHHSDLKTYKCIAYRNLVEEHAEKETELIAEKNHNDQLERELDELISSRQKLNENTDNNKYKNFEDVIAKQKRVQFDIGNELCEKIEQISQKYLELDNEYNPENINTITSEGKQELGIINQKISEEEQNLILQSNINLDLEMPDICGVFLQSDEDFMKQYGDLQTNKKKLLDIIENFHQLKEKVDNLNNN